MVAFRPKRRRNARVEIALKPFDISNLKLPNPPDLMRALAVIWQLPESAVRVEQHVRQTALISTDQDILMAQRCNEADGNGKPKTRKKVTK